MSMPVENNNDLQSEKPDSRYSENNQLCPIATSAMSEVEVELSQYLEV